MKLPWLAEVAWEGYYIDLKKELESAALNLAIERSEHAKKLIQKLKKSSLDDMYRILSASYK